MKIGVDVHGVIDVKPEFWAAFTNAIVKAGHEVHVLTGPPITNELTQKLIDFGIAWTHLFSIVDHHRKIGVGIWQDAQGFWYTHPWAWDKTKADYCAEHEIDLHIDDSEVYGHFFITPFATFDAKIKAPKVSR